MKFIHTADLHIGKTVCEHSMLDEQRHILARILEAVDSEKPDRCRVPRRSRCLTIFWWSLPRGRCARSC